MALFINNTGKRSELQEKLATELREKMARQSSGDGDGDDHISRSVKEKPDFIEDSQYVKGYEKSKPIPRQVIVLIVLVVIAVACGLVIVLAGI